MVRGKRALNEKVKICKGCKRTFVCKGDEIPKHKCKSVTKIEVTTTSTAKPLVAAPAKQGSVKAMMAEAQARGIKYFRILNKEELIRILGLTLDEDRNVADEIIDGAKKRWKAGWGTKKQEAK